MAARRKTTQAEREDSSAPRGRQPAERERIPHAGSAHQTTTKRAVADPRAARQEAILQLQGRIGNQAMGHLIAQTERSEGAPGAHSREVDARAPGPLHGASSSRRQPEEAHIQDRPLIYRQDDDADQATTPDVPGHSRAGPAQSPTRTIIQRKTIAQTMWDYVDSHGDRVSKLLEGLQRDYAEHDFDVDKVWNALLDVSLDLSAVDQEGDMREVLVQSIAAELDQNYSACYNLAAELFGLIGGRETVGQGSAMVFDSQPQFRDTVHNLTDAIARAASNRDETMFRVEYAGHGFLLIVRPDADGAMIVEHIESLAHTASLLESIEHGRPKNVQGTCISLLKMADTNPDTRRQGAAGFGWNADAINLGPEDFPHVRMRWWERPLGDTWARRWQQAVGQRYEALGSLVQGETPAWG